MANHRIARLGLAGALMLTAVLSFGPAPQAAASAPAAHEPGQVVIKLAPLVDNTLEAINLAYGTTTLDTLYNHTDVHLLQAPPGTDAAALVQLMASDPRLLYAELNFLNEDPEQGSTDRIYGWGDPSGSQWRSQDAATSLSLTSAHGWSRGAGVTVAVLDTGVQLDHPALAANIGLLGYDFVDNDLTPADEANGLDDDADGRVDEAHGHGTHVAGIVLLVAPDAVLLPLRVLNSDGRGNNFRTANAILYAAYSGADVINLSLGTPDYSALLHETVEEAAGLGVLVAAAAGNLNSSDPQYPAAEACAIGVTSLSAKDKKSSFASYGEWVSLAAPGENIYSTIPDSGYAWWSGTSMATPFVAGQAALLRAADPALSLADLAVLIGGTAESVDAKNAKYRGLLGNGKIEVLASLEAQAGGSWPAPTHAMLAGCGAS